VDIGGLYKSREKGVKEMTGESKWSTDIEEQIRATKEMIKNTKGLFFVRGGANFYHYDTQRRKK